MKQLLGVAGLLAATLLGGVGAEAATTVNLTAQRASLTLPDGTVTPMWSYCGSAAKGAAGLTSGGTCPPAVTGVLPGWTQGPTIVVPAGDKLTIVLSNTLPSPTSVTILGQVGGFIGQPTYAASPAHLGVTTSTFPNSPAPGAGFKPLDGKLQSPRARSFTQEADGNGGSQTYVWDNLKPGTYIYESGSRPSLQVPMGLYGVLVVTAPQTAGAAVPQPGAPGVAYTATVTAAIPAVPATGTAPAVPAVPAVLAPLAYDADATFLFSEVDVAQNSVVDSAALAMAGKQAPTVANPAFSALEQRTLPPSASIISNPTAKVNAAVTVGVDDCATIACYPPAVNYAPTWFLVNGKSYDRTNPAATAQIVNDNATVALTAPTNRVLVRFANAGLKTHIPTIVGMSSTLIAEDGNLQPDVALGMIKSKTPATPLVSGKVQSAMLLTAGKTLDVAITPVPGAVAGTFADQALPILDRELSLSGGGKSFSGLQGFLAIAPAGTTQATLGTVVATGTNTPILPAALAVAANADTFNVPANASRFSGNVLLNDLGVTGVVAGSQTPTYGTVTFKVDGSFSYVASGAMIVNDTFNYCGNITVANPGGVCATVTLVATDVSKDTVTAPTQAFTSHVASLLHVPHPGVLSGAASSAFYSLVASASATAPSMTPAAGATLPTSAPVCTAVTGTTGICAVTLLPDGAFTATATAPGSYTFTYFAIDAQGVSASNTATLVFPRGSGVTVTLQDAATGKTDTSATFLPGSNNAGVVVGQDYRWVIEEDQTFLHDPGNDGFVPPAFPVPIASIAMANGVAVGDGVSNQVKVTAGALPTYFKGFVAGTYVQIVSGNDAFNGVFRINSVSGNTFTYTLWMTPPVGALLGASTGTATTGQSLATNFHRSYMPVVAAGCTGVKSCNDAQTVGAAKGALQPRSYPSDVALDPTKRYFISVLPGDAGGTAFATQPALATGHAMGAAQIAAANMNVGTVAGAPVTVLVPQNPVPPGQMSIMVFEDNNPISGDIDDGERPLGGFEVVIYDTRGSSGDQAGQITYDLFNQPLTNALANQGGTGTDGLIYPNLCPTTPNGNAAPIGVIYTCMPVYDAKGNDISPFTGLALVKNVIPGRLDVQAHPAAWRGGAGEQWIQVSTLEGTPNNDTFVHPGEPAYWQEFGPPGFHSFIGFVNPAHLAEANSAAVVAAQKAKIPVATVTGRVTNLHMDRPPQGKLNDSCQAGTTDASCARAALNYTQCYVALNSQTGSGPTVAWAPCDPVTGTFTIANVPADTYEMFIWDEWLDQIKAKQLVTVPLTNIDGTPYPLSGGVVAAGDIPVFNWFTRIQETIYVDLNGNGMRDPGEPGLSNLVANVRFRDGTFSNRLTTDAQGNAFHNELFPLFNWYVLENDQTRYKNTGVHIIYDAGGVPDQTNLSVTGGLSSSEYFPTLGVLNSTEAFPLPPAMQVPGALYNTGKTERIDPPNWITEGLQGFINQTEFVEWGKQPFAPGENGGISGLIYFASVRAFDDPRLKVQNLSEPGIPRVQVNLYQRITNADGTTSDRLVDTTTSSSWDDWANGTTNGVPNMNCPGNAPASLNPPAYVAGQTDPFINYTLGSNNQYKCYDGQHAFNQVQPAVYDGYYAFPTAACAICTPVALVNNGTGLPLTNPDGTAAAPVPTLPPGQYVVEVVRPDGFEMTKEEDKNILIGDAWISAGPQQFGNLVNIFILPDQATLNDNNPAGQTLFAPPCAGLPHLVPDYLTVVPEAQQTAPYAGQIRNLCDKKLVTVSDQTASNADFQLWTPTPIAGHVSGLMLNDAAAEFDPYSPSFGEKFALPNAPISVRDFNGVEILRAYTDKWGTFDFLNVSTWEANVPNPSGYAPNMLTYCMNDPGPTPDPAHPGKFRTDPYYNPQYSDFCYNWPILPGVTTYLDTPVLPVSAFASHYAPVDCQYANLTPAILRVDGNWVPTAAQAFLPATVTTVPSTGTGPYVDMAKAGAALTITALGDVSVLNPAYAGPTALAGTTYDANRITRHYGFGNTRGTLGAVQLINTATGTTSSIPGGALAWSDGKIVATLPANLVNGSYELVITGSNGVKSVDTVTVTVDRSSAAGYRQPWYVAAPPPGTGIGAGNGWGLPHPIQDAIDSSKVLPGDLVIVDAGLYPELDVMWKPVRLQGVGAAAVTIQATKYPNSKIADWRSRINLLFGLMPDGNQFVDAAGNAYPTQIDPLPGQTVNTGITRLEPTALSTEEGAGITVLAANNQSNPKAVAGCLTQAQLAALVVQPTVNFAPATPNGFYPVNQPLTGNAAANQPVPATAAGRFYSDFACYAARIDGISVTGSDAGGGIYVNGWAHNIQISNNRVFGNSGPYAGGVRVGQPYLEGQVNNPLAQTLAYNVNVKIHHNAISTNGTDEANAAPGTPVGTSGAGGGLAIEAGTDNFSVTNNWICGNFSAGDGGGMGVVGNSTPGVIANNTIIFNESYQQTGPSYGGGLAIEGEPGSGTAASTGVGNILVNANLIQGNSVRSGSGGGVRLALINGGELLSNDATVIDNTGPLHAWQITLSNNIIVNNVAGWSGGGVSLADAIYTNFWGNTVANNDSLGTAGILMNTMVNGLPTGPSTSVPNPAGFASDPDSPDVLAAISALPANRPQPPSKTISQPSIMSNNILYHNRSQFFDAKPANAALVGVQLCSSNQWTDAVAHNCAPLPAQTATGQCVAGASYWDVGVTGDQSPATGAVAGALQLDHSVLSTAYAGTGNTVADPLFAKAYCNGGRVNPGAQFEPGSPFQLPFAMSASATLDESGNYVDIQFGPLSLQDPANPINYTGNYHLSGKAGSAYDAGLTPTAAQLAAHPSFRRDIDNDLRPQNAAYDIGADEVGATVAYSAILTAPGGALASPAANAYSFGTVGVGITSAPAIFTYTNTGAAAIVLAATPVTVGGTNAGNFAIVAGVDTTCTTGATVAPGTSCTIAVSFTPTAAGARGPASLIVTDATAGVVNVGDPAFMSGIGAAPTATLFAPGSVVTSAAAPYSFGGQAQGVASAAATFSYTNTGIAPVTLAAANAVRLAGTNAADFAIVASGTSCTSGAVVPVGASCTIAVSFRPSNTGTRTATLTVTDASAAVVNTGDPAYLTGTDIAPTGIFTPASAAFASQAVGTTSGPVTFTFTNNSASAIVLANAPITKAGANPNDFTVSTGTTCTANSTVAAGANCLVNITFAPTAPGSRSGSFMLVTATPNVTITNNPVTLTGTATGGAVGVLGLSATSIDLSTLPPATTRQVTTLTLSNTGTANLNIASVAVTTNLAGTVGRFSVVNSTANPCPVNGNGAITGTLAPNATCALTVRYTPATALGVVNTTTNTGTLTINTTGTASSPSTVSLTGN